LAGKLVVWVIKFSSFRETKNVPSVKRQGICSWIEKVAEKCKDCSSSIVSFDRTPYLILFLST
jgi:hypothetical protein